MARRTSWLAAVALLLTVLTVTGCGGSSSPSAAELEAKGDIAGLIKMATTGGEFSSDENAQAAVEALRRLGDPTIYDQLARLLRSIPPPGGGLSTTPDSIVDYYVSEGDVMRVLGQLGGPTGVAIILDWVRNADTGWTAIPHDETVLALAAAGNAATEPLAAILDQAGTKAAGNDYELRLIAIDVFGGRTPDAVRRTSTGALGTDREEQVLLSVLRLNDRDYSARAGASIVARRADQPAVVLPLLDDPSTVRIAWGLVLLGASGTEPALVAALERSAGAVASDIAHSFITSGNPTLEGAGEGWFSSHGYTIIPYCPAPPCVDKPTWGTLFSPE